MSYYWSLSNHFFFFFTKCFFVRRHQLFGLQRTQACAHCSWTSEVHHRFVLRFKRKGKRKEIALSRLFLTFLFSQEFFTGSYDSVLTRWSETSGESKGFTGKVIICLKNGSIRFLILTLSLCFPPVFSGPHFPDQRNCCSAGEKNSLPSASHWLFISLFFFSGQLDHRCYGQESSRYPS